MTAAARCEGFALEGLIALRVATEAQARQAQPPVWPQASARGILQGQLWGALLPDAGTASWLASSAGSPAATPARSWVAGLSKGGGVAQTLHMVWKVQRGWRLPLWLYQAMALAAWAVPGPHPELATSGAASQCSQAQGL